MDTLGVVLSVVGTLGTIILVGMIVLGRPEGIRPLALTAVGAIGVVAAFAFLLAVV